MSDTTPPVPPVPPPGAPDSPQPGYAAPQPGYGQPPYAPSAPGPYGQPAASGQPYAPYPSAPRTNTLAIVALVLAFVVPLGGIVCGHIALSQIKRTGEEGHGLALAGTVIGYVWSGLIVLFAIAYFVFLVVLFGSLAATGSSVSQF